MENTLFYIFGLITGILLLRYGFGLGVHSVYQINADKPIGEKEKLAEIDQSATNEFEED